MPRSIEQQQELASLYVAGALTPQEQRQFEAELQGDAGLRKLVRDLQGAADAFALAAPQVALPSDLKGKVLQRVGGSASASQRPTKLPLPGFLFHGASDQQGWKALPIRGAWIKLLTLEREKGYAVLMGRLEAGVRYPAHTHAGAEELFILTGDLNIGELRLNAGDFHHSDPGTSHADNHSIGGCTLLAVLPADHELVQLAMA